MSDKINKYNKIILASLKKNCTIVMYVRRSGLLVVINLLSLGATIEYKVGYRSTISER